jgi:small-conductance mechanosensitive channel
LEGGAGTMRSMVAPRSLEIGDMATIEWIDRVGELLESYGLSWEIIHRWLVALAVFLAVVVVLRIALRVLRRRCAAWVEKDRFGWGPAIAELLGRTRLWFHLLLAAYCASLVLNWPAELERIIRSVAVVGLLVQGAIWGVVVLDFLIRRRVQQQIETDAAVATTMAMLGFLAKLTMWTIVSLLILENVGIDVTALVAGLGIGGIAVALAAQNILSDLFASLSIVLDKPFVLGDYIVVGDDAGTVEHIGVKTTRVRSLSGEQLVFSNGDLLKARIRNFKRMQERRVAFTVSVTHQTPLDKLAAIAGVLRDIVQAQPQVRFDRSHFKSLGDSALVFEVVYFMLVPDYGICMDTQQAVNLAIIERFRHEGIDFAYPTQTVFQKST